jgi:cysteine desulfurase
MTISTVCKSPRTPYNARVKWFTQERIYLDYASAPPVLPEASAAVAEGEKLIGNPGAIHAEGVAAKRALEDARSRCSALLGVKSRELIFTAGLTESNNIAILGSARAIERAKRTLEGTHWIVSSIEHTSVLDCFSEIERLGGTVTHIDPGANGLISVDSIKSALTPQTVFVSVGWANNEIGTIQPLSDISRALRAYGEAHSIKIVFHTDAGQAPVYLATGLNSLGVDLCSIGGNKLYGPHGIGLLFISTRTDLARVVQGGPQERGLRPGTESVALALGIARAFEVIVAMRASEARRIRGVRDALADEITKHVTGSVINGDTRHALPHMLNISIPDIQSEYVTLKLDQAGIAVSTKSACREGEESRSHVVEALSADKQVPGGEPWRAQNTLRFSLGITSDKTIIPKIMGVLTTIDK